MSSAPMLLAVPNVSEGADRAVLDRLVDATRPARLLDLHSDPDHGRSVLTLAAPQGRLAPALVRLARAAAELIDVTAHAGIHPHVGALDVAPVVHLDDATRGAAVAEALTAAALIGEEGIPVLLYGALATSPAAVERAAIRAGGPAGLADRIRAGQVTPDYGPPRALHPTAGATLVTARPPLIAFNVDLVTDDVAVARRIAARLRESGGGPPGVRAIGLALPSRGRAQVSFNVHDHRAAPLRDLVAAVRQEAEVAEAELVGLAPAAAFEGFPADVPLRAFDSGRHLIENALRSQ
ncbi:MAG: glutamate formiminotransferase / 5-formyltetrahydrofolate cyclo-ligase [Thermoleophilaceae bacterium]|nr:glutamate formiminotransferase / 5-formyltetrahydrofolate cyclo-ligase [Thermoleophilaceae bacterium]